MQGYGIAVVGTQSILPTLYSLTTLYFMAQMEKKKEFLLCVTSFKIAFDFCMHFLLAGR